MSTTTETVTSDRAVVISVSGTDASSPVLSPLQSMGHRNIAPPGIPHFSDISSKRQWQLEHLAAAFRVFGRLGYAEGIAGHISVRDPEFEDRFWINPLGIHYSCLEVSDMICLDMQGNVVGGNKSLPANAAGFTIHAACHLARPDAHAICHAHSLYGKAWATFGRPLDMINQDVCYFYKGHTIYDDYGGIAFGSTEGSNIAQALGDARASILVNHGLITVGATVDEAAYLFTLLEKSCQIQLMVEATRLPKRIIPDHDAAAIARVAGDPESLYVEFQPQYQLEESLDASFKR